jgi:hypothetical protein
MQRRRWFCSLLLLLCATARADEPPVKNRPALFHGAVGSFDVTMTAQPTEVPLDQKLALTVRITATGPVQQPPRRPNLRELSAFTERFHIEDVPDKEDEAAGTAPTAWEYRYHLKPRNLQVEAVPSLPFVSYKPGRPGTRGTFQTHYAPRIPLIVKPVAAPPLAVQGGNAPSLQGPESAYQLWEGDALLERAPTGNLLGPGTIVLGLAAPWLVCGAWYLLWRRRYPDAARQARQRRSRAARDALQALRALRPRGPDDEARQAAAIVAAYLRERVELTTAEPTPGEAAARLQTVGVSREGAEDVGHFFRAAAAARFAPTSAAPPTEWGTSAADLILRLESEPCLGQAV